MNILTKNIRLQLPVIMVFIIMAAAFLLLSPNDVCAQDEDIATGEMHMDNALPQESLPHASHIDFSIYIGIKITVPYLIGAILLHFLILYFSAEKKQMEAYNLSYIPAVCSVVLANGFGMAIMWLPNYRSSHAAFEPAFMGFFIMWLVSYEVARYFVYRRYKFEPAPSMHLLLTISNLAAFMLGPMIFELKV